MSDATTCTTCDGTRIECPCGYWSCWYRRLGVGWCRTCDVPVPETAPAIGSPEARR
jgi:hypothetical protein